MTKKTDPFDLAAGVPKLDGALRPAPKVAERISKRVLYVLFGVISVLVAVFLFALDNMDNKGNKPPEENNAVNYATTNANDLMDIGRASLKMDAGNLISQDNPSAVPSKEADLKLQEVPPIPQYQPPPPLTPEQQRMLAEEEARHQRDIQARMQGMSSKVFSGAVAGGAGDPQLSGLLDKLKGAMEGAGAKKEPVVFGGSSGPGDGDQERKTDFLAKMAKESQDYHPHAAVPARSKNEIKTGSFIPMVLEQSINSDLPGQITARVTEDVYDSITGCRMLIPAMSKVVGRYDSKVAIGQGRMLIAWNSLIFKDGAELNLAGLQGYDTSGQAGLESDVDNHYWRLFGLTFGLSMITTGVQLSVPQPNPSSNGAPAPVSPAQTIAASLSQQYGTLGSQIIAKYMAVQPTLRNFTGERFIVMVPRTIVFNKVWRSRCGDET